MQWQNFVPSVIQSAVKGSFMRVSTPVKAVKVGRAKIRQARQTLSNLVSKGIRATVLEQDMSTRLKILDTAKRVFGKHFSEDPWWEVSEPSWLRGIENDVLDRVWMDESEQRDIESALAVFQSRVHTGSGIDQMSSAEYSSYNPLNGWPVDYSPAKDPQGALALTASGKYQWVYKSAHDNTGDKRSGFMLREVVNSNPKPWRVPDGEVVQDSVRVATPPLASNYNQDLLDPRT